MNSVILMGRLTSDPEVRTSPNDITNAKFTVAVDRPYSGSDKERKTDFIRVTCWRNTAEFVERYFAKGKPILIQGSIQTGSYQDKDGKTIYTTDVVADKVEFVISDKSQNSAPATAKNAEDKGGGFTKLETDEIPF